MKKILSVVALAASFAVPAAPALTGCSSQPPATAAGDAGADSQGGSSSGASSSGSFGSSSGGAGLKWYFTCGDPVCHVPSGDAGGLTDDAGTPCPDIGSTCSAAGEQCGTRNADFNCGAVEQCDTHDPTTNPGGCPISSRAFKDGIRYVDGAGLEQLHDEILRLRLATYRYKPAASDPSREHVGFIIEDTPPTSPAVDARRDHVDLYGYMSMLVATMQVQEKEIADLRRELEAARRENRGAQ
jgi:hypothetical protein